jgi:hypothetical protein
MSPNGGAKALIVIDQVGYDQLKPHLKDLPTGAHVVPLRLGYIPRTTPVGHTTISTGKLPFEHRVQGRVWFKRIGGALLPQDIDTLPIGSFDTVHRTELFDGCLARTIRRHNREARIVTVAAKAFIPFLIGGTDSDVLLYPTDTKPQLDDEGNWRVIVRVHPRTSAGVESVRRKHRWVLQQVKDLVKRHDPKGDVTGSWDPDDPTVYEIDWVLSPEFPVRKFKDVVLDYGWTFDEAYARVGNELLDDLEGDAPKFFLQSWFSTDMVGHLVGNSDPRYAAAVKHALLHVETLHRAGYLVVATSDHGGRCTSEVLLFEDGKATDPAGIPIELPSGAQVVRSGDHLVGYELAAPRDLVVESWDGSRRRSVTLQPGISQASFASDQAPSWLLLPKLHQRYAEKREKGGGDHGACAHDDTLSDVDDVVPLLTLGATNPPPPPSALDGVAAYFMSLI